MKHAAATLGSGNLRLAVMLPEGEDLNEWVAVNSNIVHLLTILFINIVIILKPLTFSIKSICFMEQSLSFAPKNHAH